MDLIHYKQNEDFWVSKLKDMPVCAFSEKTSKVALASCEISLDKSVTKFVSGIDKGNPNNRMMIYLMAYYVLLKNRTNSLHQVIRFLPGGGQHSEESPTGPGFIVLKPEKEESLRTLLKFIFDGLQPCLLRNSYSYAAFKKRLTAYHPDGAVTLTYAEFAYNVISKDADTSFESTSLSMQLTENNDKSCITWNYNQNEFSKEDIQLLHDQYITILKQAIPNLEKKLTDITGLSDWQKQKIESFNRVSQRVFEDEEGFLHHFSQQVAANSSKPALLHNEEIISYKELDQLSNNVANQINRRLQQNKEAIVGIITKTNSWRIIGILGILKSGAAYLPIKDTFPAARANYMLKDCDCSLLLTDEYCEAYAESLKNIENITLSEKNISPAEKLNKVIPFSEDDLFVILYTSGTTGKPKGVQIEHGNMADRLKGEVELYDLDDSIITIQTSNYAFDSSLLDIFLPMFLGGQMVLPEEDIILDFDLLADLLEKHHVTDIQCNPNFLKRFIDRCIERNQFLTNSLKRIWSGGESLDKLTVDKLSEYFSHIRLGNHYGPTEGTIDAIVDLDVSEFHKDIIGRPMINMQVYISNENLEKLPIGVPGEIIISGKGVARGYLNQEKLTKDKFGKNSRNSANRIYKTGDLGRWLPNGKIEYLGRIDDQVKIRGYRIEPKEVERIFADLPGISQTCAIITEDESEKSIMLVYTLEKEVSLEENTIKEYCRLQMPEYMRPSAYVKVEEFPQNSNGKTDKKELLNICRERLTARKVIAPQSTVEEEILKVWQKLIPNKRISITDNFFEVGGNSLIAAEMVFELYKIRNVKLNLSDIFNHPTIRQLADVIEINAGLQYEKIPRSNIKAMYKASKAQERIWLACQFQSTASSYNISDAYQLRGSIDPDIFQKTFYLLLQRHEILRTNFLIREDGLYQVIRDFSELEHTQFQFIDLSKDEDQKMVVDQLIRDAIDQQIDFEKGSLVWAKLVRIKEDCYYFFLSTHHIISDERSFAIYLKEFYQLYDSECKQNKNQLLAPQNYQYRDYSEWSILKDDFQYELDYWKKHLDGHQILELPYDFAKSSVGGREGYHEVSLSDYVADIARLNSHTNTSLFMVLLSVFNVFLHKLCRQNDIMVGTMVLGRSHPDLSDLIGMFVNTIIIRNKISEDQSYLDFLRSVKGNFLEGIENEQIDFDLVVQAVSSEKNTQKEPMVNVFFEYQSLIEVSSTEFEITSMDSADAPFAKNSLSVEIVERQNGLFLKWNYNTALFKKSSITSFSDQYLVILESILQDSEQLIKSIEFPEDDSLKNTMSQVSFNFSE